MNHTNPTATISVKAACEVEQTITQRNELYARRFGGLVRLYGVQGAQAIADAHVVIVGVGGVGSWAAEALARSGIGHLTLIDMDHISESNINRQIHATVANTGQSKVQAMSERIALINPDCLVDVVDDFVSPENWHFLFANLSAPAHAVLDCCDQMFAKVTMAAWALHFDINVGNKSKRTTQFNKNTPYFLTVGAAGGKRLAHQVEIEDIAHTTNDPLMARLRHQLRKHHQAPNHNSSAKVPKKIGVSCVFSREGIQQSAQQTHDVKNGIKTNSTLNCAGYGSVVSVTATFGHCAAGWVLDKIATAHEKGT